MALDKAIFKPVSKGYSYLPSPVKTSIGNATSNVSYLVTIPNQILQGKIYAAANDTGRFLINTTVGILGLFDPASRIGLEKKEHEDYGQTLGVWGVGHGCYVVLPVFGPSTVRDTVGKVGNMALDPFYLSTVGDKELLLDNNLGDRTYYIEQGFDKINWRAENGKSIDDLEKNSIDFYASVRSVYLQRRDNLTNDGKSTADDEWKEFK
jgi:phospholipid-binding lipoprotein MlaA